jgi:hypothetical protein
MIRRILKEIFTKISVSEDNLLVYEKRYSLDFIRRTIQKRKLDGLFVYDVLDPLPSFDFLAEFTFLTQLRMQPCDDYNYSYLLQLTNLRYLYIGEPTTDNLEIDLSAQTNLVELGLHWRKNIKGLENCSKLHSLFLTEYTEKNLSFIQNAPTVRELIIKTGSMTGLAGIESCQDLESIYLANCRSLKSIGALNHHPNLKSIELDLCGGKSGIQDFHKLTDLPGLEKLIVFDCKLPSIHFITQIPSLKKVILRGRTEIMDGDVRPLLRVPEVNYQNRANYNVPYPPSNLRKIVN